METKQTIITTKMHARSIGQWERKKADGKGKHPWIPYSVAIAASVLLVGSCIVASPASVQVMSHMESGFDYDETLGRLQYVSNILPESAMVFLSSTGGDERFFQPLNGEIVHAWNQNEPWLEYTGNSDVFSCQQGEVMSVVKNAENRYTVRVLHEDGYESIYSGLSNIKIKEHETVATGECIGSATKVAAFELRKDGLAILPIFESK